MEEWLGQVCLSMIIFLKQNFVLQD
jgi:hypothetical protein